jgi:SNF2 family DNA or RNA helicase
MSSKQTQLYCSGVFVNGNNMTMKMRKVSNHPNLSKDVKPVGPTYQTLEDLIENSGSIMFLAYFTSQSHIFLYNRNMFTYIIFCGFLLMFFLYICIGKMVLLDKLLHKLKERGSKVFIFSTVIVFHCHADLNELLV